MEGTLSIIGVLPYWSGLSNSYQIGCQIMRSCKEYSIEEYLE
jgi:hypothetical protein